MYTDTLCTFTNLWLLWMGWFKYGSFKKITQFRFTSCEVKRSSSIFRSLEPDARKDLSPCVAVCVLCTDKSEQHSDRSNLTDKYFRADHSDVVVLKNVYITGSYLNAKILNFLQMLLGWENIDFGLIPFTFSMLLFIQILMSSIPTYFEDEISSYLSHGFNVI